MTVLQETAIEEALGNLPGWKRSGQAIERTFEFADFKAALAFVNQLGEAAEAANHHPDIDIRYNKVRASLISHDSGGVTARDLRMALKINQLKT